MKKLSQLHWVICKQLYKPAIGIELGLEFSCDLSNIYVFLIAS